MLATFIGVGPSTGAIVGPGSAGRSCLRFPLRVARMLLRVDSHCVSGTTNQEDVAA